MTGDGMLEILLFEVCTDRALLLKLRGKRCSLLIKVTTTQVLGDASRTTPS